MVIDKENLLNNVKVDYQSVYSCEEYGCYEEGICRCSTILSVDNIIIDIPKLSIHFYNKYKISHFYPRSSKIKKILLGVDDEGLRGLMIEGIEKVFESNKIWEIKNWNIEISYMYYGEEVTSVCLRDEVVERLNSELKSILSK
ncbi:hypothetical protein EBU94_04730 [bacterium]|nr:hypothetical protein [bacterium]